MKLDFTNGGIGLKVRHNISKVERHFDLVSQFLQLPFFPLGTLGLEETKGPCSGFIYLQGIIYANLGKIFKVPGITSLPMFSPCQMRAKNQNFE